MVPQPPMAPGTQWWARPLWLALETMRNTLPLKAARPMVCDSLFSGMLTERYGDHAMGLNIHLRAAVERKPAAIKFIRRNHNEVTHIFKDVDAMVAGNYSSCVVCGPRCRGPGDTPPRTWCVWGPLASPSRVAATSRGCMYVCSG